MKQKKRLVIIACGLFFLFSLLIVTYFKIQVVDGEKWTKQALAQHELIVNVPFHRGMFYAFKRAEPQKTQPLVYDVTKFHLYIDPLSIPEACRDEVAANVGAFVPVDRGEFDRRSRSRRLALWLDRETKEGIWTWWRGFAREKKIARNALYFVTDYQRSYPFGRMLGQVLHTIQDQKEENTLVGLPTGGLEAYFNDELKGKLGKRKLLRSPLNQLDIDQVIEEPEDGADIFLTLDHNIQAIVEEELEKGIHAAQAKGGWAVMLDPHNGEVLALAQYPYFDPANYRDFFNDPERIEDAKVKAVSDAFELGSIMKPITMAIALKGEGVDPEEKIDVTRSSFPGRASRPLFDTPRHKALNMAMAIQKSSNVYMAQVIDHVVEKWGKEWYRNELVETFGFAQKTGLELPGEASGLVPTPGKLHPNGALEWSKPTPYSLAMGYNLLATSLQMVRAYAVFANGGYLVEPTLVRKIAKGDEILFEAPHTKKRVLDGAITQQVVRVMKFTTQQGGTGWRASVSGFTEAGKTGTAEKIVGGVYSKQRYISSFVGFAPVEEARFVLVVTLDEPAPIRLEGGVKNYVGGKCSAPVFKEIAERTLHYLGVPLDDPHGFPRGDPRYDPESADWIKEVQELKQLYDLWNNA